MSDRTNTQTADQQRAANGLSDMAFNDVVEMASLRWQLAELEMRSDLAAAKRLGLIGGLGLLAVISSVPVLTVVLAGQLDTVLANRFPWVSLFVGCLLLFGGLFVVWWGWRHFRREFLGLRESLNECREDLVWIREWAEDWS